jgi:hypothetical protein
MAAGAVAALAIPGGLFQSPALASSSTAPNWTRQSPATSPAGRYDASMTYDAATGNTVLFGGFNARPLSDTWAWDGSTWTNQVPATTPHPREYASMAYDAAISNVVLFGGTSNQGGTRLDDTWAWGS